MTTPNEPEASRTPLTNCLVDKLQGLRTVREQSIVDLCRILEKSKETELQEAREIIKNYVVAMDKIYNHNEASRVAVIQYFGLWHPQSALTPEPSRKEEV